MKKHIVLSYIFAVLAVIACVVSSINFLKNEAFSEWISSISTIFSIALSIISMINSCITERETSKTLDEIKEQNKRLVDMINHNLSKDNFDEENIKSLLE